MNQVQGKIILTQSKKTIEFNFTFNDEKLAADSEGTVSQLNREIHPDSHKYYKHDKSHHADE
jgi:hypothetical protein